MQKPNEIDVAQTNCSLFKMKRNKTINAIFHAAK